MERFVMTGFPLLNYIFSQGFLPQVKKKVVGQPFFSKETFMTRWDTHEHENNKVFSYQRLHF